jgi:hypothetical protein
MFIQIIEGKLADKDLFRRQIERWRAELKPSTPGYLGSTGGYTADGRAVAVVRFESEDAARASSERPEQDAWWNETVKAFDGDPTFQSSTEVDTMLGGGADDAGFVQLIRGRAKDKAAVRATMSQFEEELPKVRPDLRGIVVAWHEGNDFTQIAYFTSEAAARENESATAQSETRNQWTDLLDGEPSFVDITEVDID